MHKTMIVTIAALASLAGAAFAQAPAPVHCARIK
jgi:hypothetical protein